MKDNILNKLETYANTVHRSFFFISVIEIICAIVIGISSNHLGKDNIIFLLLFVSFIYLSVVIIRLFYHANFPGSITNELKSAEKVIKLQKLNERQGKLSTSHFETIRNLNIQTCGLGDDQKTSLCDTGVQKSLKKLLNPIILNTEYLLNCSKSTNFTYGIYLNKYHTLDCSSRDKGIIIIHDGLNKESSFPKELFSKTDLSDEKLEIQNIFKKCFNNKKFVSEDYKVNDIELTLTCSHMYEACHEDNKEKELLGFLFILSDKISEIPDDLETQMKIFNRVISNWVHSYDECVINIKSNG